MNLPIVLSNDDGIRPAGKQDECFYCNQKIGEPHKIDCVILCRKVKVRYSYEIEVEVPHFWGKGMIESHRNESSWCAYNSLNEIKEYAKEADSCLCYEFSMEVLEVPDALPYRRNKKGEIVE